eukprot:GHRR01026790.1.p1 GENE.GHRR01026790.1~~GHRR01026790.1.p1  ORF type:complete len:355 (+),score=84.47 GHRR01026790.1:404-1468(+)
MFHLLTWLSRNCPSRWFASSPCGDCCDCLHLLPSRLSVLDNLWMGHHEIFCTYSCGKWLRCLLVLVSLGQAYHQVSCSCCIRPCQVALHAMISYCPKRFTACSGAYCCCILFFLVPLQIKEENPRLARDSKVLRVTMDNVYEVFTSPRDTTGLQGIHFRFMPDMVQVKHALQLYKEAGVPTRSFIGVPVFQAEGLTVTTQDMQYVPLFLTKEDLDVAVGGAYRQRNATQISAVKDKAAQYEAEYQQAMTEADSAGGRDKALLEAKAGKVKSKLDDALSKASAIQVAPLPKIEVGSFEEVLMRMSASEGSELSAWSQVMFVAPGLLQQANTPGAAAQVEAAGSGKSLEASGTKKK